MIKFMNLRLDLLAVMLYEPFNWNSMSLFFFSLFLWKQNPGGQIELHPGDRGKKAAVGFEDCPAIQRPL